MARYYCSGFDINNAFGHGLGEMFKSELINTKSIVYIPGGLEKIEKVLKEYNMDLSVRAEQISSDIFIAIANSLEE